MATKIQLRRDTLTNWIKEDPILMDGEVALVAIDDAHPNTYEHKKIGDGIHKFSELTLISDKRDTLFDQVDTFLDGNAATASNVKEGLLKKAKMMPSELFVTINEITDILNSDVDGLFDMSPSHRLNFSDAPNAYSLMFNASKLSGLKRFKIKVNLKKLIPYGQDLLPYIHRFIVISSIVRIKSRFPWTSHNNLRNYLPDRLLGQSLLDIPEEAALLVYSDLDRCMRLHDRLLFRMEGFAQRLYGELNVPFRDTLHRHLYGYMDDIYATMGLTYKNIHDTFGSIGKYSLIGTIDFYGDRYDAFFGVLPDCRLEVAYINADDELEFVYFYEGAYQDIFITPINFRIVFPKNEIITNIVLDNIR